MKSCKEMLLYLLSTFCSTMYLLCTYLTAHTASSSVPFITVLTAYLVELSILISILLRSIVRAGHTTYRDIRTIYYPFSVI